MAIVRLEFDLDSDVYPELHAALAALGARSRAERVRQLAAAGLVWENVRIHGSAVIGPTVLPAEKPVSAARPAPSPAPVSPPAAVPPMSLRTSERSAPAAGRGGTRRPAGPVQPLDDHRGSDFVDLAIDAVPVLMDIVPDDEVVTERPEARPTLSPPVLSVAAPPPLPARVLDDDPQQDSQRDDDGGREAREEALAAAPDDAGQLTALAQKPATRSRLMRMKEKGLFKNG
jgi:hypothetical protein